MSTTVEVPTAIQGEAHTEALPMAAERTNSRQNQGWCDNSRHEALLDAAIISELQSSKLLAVALLASTGAYAIGHGATALAAGLLGRTLVRQGGMVGFTPSDRGALYSIICLGLLATLVKCVSAVFLGSYEARLAGGVGQGLRGRAVRALLDHGSPDAAPTLLATIAVRIREIEGSVTGGFLLLVRSVAQLVPLAVALIWLSPPLALAGLLVLTPFAVLVARHRERWRAAHAGSQALCEALHRGVDDLVRHVDLWRTYGAGGRVAEAVQATSTRAVAAAARVRAARAALSGANEVLAAVALLGAVLLSLELRIPLGDGTLVAFAAVFFMAYRPLRDLGDARASRSRGAVAAQALAGLIRSDASPAAANSIVHHDTPVARRLALESVGARDRGPLTTLDLAPGDLVTVVGPTGSGKTTLLRVLLGLEPARGRVLHGHEDITEAPVGPEARPFAWVPQDAPLVTDTVLANVGLHASDERAAVVALEQIGAEPLIELGDVVVGPGGRALSGGERRQVAIARALASGQPILLLDEPIAGLDRASAERVLEALGRLRGQRSLLVVTHRPEVIAISDRVIRIGS